MTSNGEVKIAAARQDQSKRDKLDLRERLLGKTARTKTLTVNIDGDSLELKFQALSSKNLDELRSKHQPTAKQRVEGLGVNVDTFNPALVAATLIQPELTYDEAVELFSAENWSAGELGQIFQTASDVCLEGMDIPRNASV